MPFRPLTLVFVFLGATASAADPFQETVAPFLKAYCVDCHNPKKAGGDLDLTKFLAAAKPFEDFRQWEHIVGFVKKEEMPPAKAKQPRAAQRLVVLAAMEELLFAEAAKFAGDPGVVPPRRLSNAEYDNTIRDITGANIRPAASFPLDPASGEGFNNTGEALTISPSLFKKYYAAGEFVGDHALLTTAGLRFAPHPVVAFADRQKFYERAILAFYERHTVDQAQTLAVLWTFKHRPVKREGTTVESWATERGVSAKYARLLWDALEGKEDRVFLAWLRERWNKFPAPKTPADPNPADVRDAAKSLADDAAKLGKELNPKETPPIVADAGNGPIDHLARRRKTAAERGTFDRTAAAPQRLTQRFENVSETGTLKLVVQVADTGGLKADGTLLLDGAFTTNSQTTDGKKKWSLRAVLAEHAPDQLAKLKFDGEILAVKAPAVVEIEIPQKAFPLKNKGSVTFTAECRLDGSTGGIALVRVLDRKPGVSDRGEDGSRPLLDPKHPVAGQFEASAEDFCRLFPNRFYYVDGTRGLSAGFHLIEGFFRDDQPLCKWVLTDAENKELDALWDELYFVTGIWEKMLRGFVFFERSERNFLKHADFDPFREEDPFLTTDETLAKFQEAYLKRSNVKLTGEALANHPVSIFFTDIRQGLKRRSETLKKLEPQYLKDLQAFAEKAYRRPLTDAERAKLAQFFAAVSADKDHGVEAAVRNSVIRVLASPHFILRFDASPAGDSVAPVSELALASRLSYFIWAGPPDEALLALAKAGKLRDEKTLREQVRRMLKDPKVSRFALEFFGQWFGYRDFLAQEQVNRQTFPAFDDALRQAMFEEPTRLAAHLIQSDKPITDLLNSDATFVNKKLATHYGLNFTGKPDDWELATGLHAKGRGGVLGMGVFLTKNSQPQRTSPVKRGFWVVHKVLGEHIPPPPPDVAVLPAKESETGGKTVRELLKLHVADAKCASCHQRFDPVGLAMEGFDPIGRSRTKDLAGRAIDNAVSLPTGAEAKGVPAFGDYLVKARKGDFEKTLCQKFLGYALGRSLQLSDQPLLEKMRAELESKDDKLSTLFELVALSPQFRTQRCKDFNPDKFKPEPIPGERK